MQNWVIGVGARSRDFCDLRISGTAAARDSYARSVCGAFDAAFAKLL